MNWSRVKTFLIIIFALINVFLIVRLVQKNSDYIDTNAISTVVQILKNKNVELLTPIPQAKRSYKRILIRNENSKIKNIANYTLFVSLNNIKTPNIKVDNTNIVFENYIGKGKNIIQAYDILLEFIRKTGITNTKVSDVRLGYFIDFDKYQSNLKTAEINPSWQIRLENGKTYVFDAYNAELLYEGK